MPSAHADAPSLRRALLDWYDANRRDLPWRASTGALRFASQEEASAYHVWLSEIMLQQTRVTAVIPYFERFRERFPDIHQLSKADEADVLALWSGLGYYRRARQLLAAARQIVAEYQGQFPRDFASALRLPGIGRYTAGAILSIAYGLALPAVDGNVLRVVSRVTGKNIVDARLAEDYVRPWIDAARPGDFNQALMELGATVCLPKAPQCLICPLSACCRTQSAALPLPRARKQVSVTQHYSLRVREQQIYLVQRVADESLMPGMWELPVARRKHKPLGAVMHTITCYRIEARVYQERASALDRDVAVPTNSGRWVAREQLGNLPLTGLTRKILRKFCDWQ